jgi:hypothetical protein
MSKTSFIVAIMSFGLISGLFSPALPIMFVIVTGLAPGLLISSIQVVLMIASILTATVTIMAAGIPAAIYERIAGLEASNETSWFIWLACTAILALPAVINGIGQLTT